MSIGDVRALLFDTFGTVVDWRGSIARQLAAEFADLDAAEARDWAAFADAWRARYQPAMEEVRSERRPFVVLDVLHRENLEATAVQFGLTGLPGHRLDRINRFWHTLDPWPDSVAGMARLGRRYAIVAQSNGNVALMVDMKRHAGLPWDMILGAEVVGFYKRRPESYLRAAAMLGLEPAQCMMVAAHNDDLGAARALGLRTAMVLRPDEHGPAQTTDLAPAQAWDVVADSMEDLAARLGL
jgi:2-haloacid dehalogenase